MTRALAAALGLLILILTPVGAAENKQLAIEKIDAVTRRAPLRKALWGVLIEGEQGEVLFERNADTLMTPASVRKLFSGMTVLECSGVDGHLETSIAITGMRRGNVLLGDLVVRGGGDPSLGGRWEYDSDRNARFRPIVDTLKRLGIKRIEGNIVVDVSAFDDVLIPGSWKSDNLGNSWAAPVDSIAYNENVVGVRVFGRSPASAVVELDPEFALVSIEEPCTRTRHVVGISTGNVVTVGCSRTGTGTLSYLLSVEDPALFAGSAIRSFLLSSGIEVGGVRTTKTRVTDARTVAVIESPPIGMLLSAALEDSANLYAEMLLKSLALGEEPASYDRALAIERAFLLESVKLGGDEFSFDDGSGLSSEDSVTPRATVRLLEYIERVPSRRHFVMDALASPGEGTLRKRLDGLEDRVFAKTGSIDGVNALTGWVRGSSGGWRRFAIFINHHSAGNRVAKDAIDDIVKLIADF